MKWGIFLTSCDWGNFSSEKACDIVITWEIVTLQLQAGPQKPSYLGNIVCLLILFIKHCMELVIINLP
jgi:hypothetical protein